MCDAAIAPEGSSGSGRHGPRNGLNKPRRRRSEWNRTFRIEATEHIDAEMVRFIRDQMREAYPDNPCLILAKPLRLGAVLRPDEAAA